MLDDALDGEARLHRVGTVAGNGEDRRLRNIGCVRDCKLGGAQPFNIAPEDRNGSSLA